MSLDGYKEYTSLPDTKDLLLKIVQSKYNYQLTEELCNNTIKALKDLGVPDCSVSTVPGAAEIPYAANMYAKRGGVDCIIALGVVIQGKTDHHNIIANATSITLNQISLKYELPIINGILVTKNKKDAIKRCGHQINRGKEFAFAAVEMAKKKKRIIVNNKD